jgi:hypothetical protein
MGRKGGIPVGNEVDDGFHIVGCGAVWWPGYEDFAEIGCRRVKYGDLSEWTAGDDVTGMKSVWDP